MGNAFSAKVQKDITKSINESVVEFASEQVSECFSQSRQTLRLLIERSNLLVTGDFAISQEAKLAFSCIQQQDNSAQLLQDLEEKIKVQLKQKLQDPAFSVLSVDVQLSETQLSSIINSSVKLDSRQICQASLTQNADIQIKDSDVCVGCCAPGNVASAEAICLAFLNASAASGTFDSNNLPPSCNVAATCAENAGKFLIEQGVTFSSSCDQSQKIAAEITQKLKKEFEKQQSQEKEPFELFSSELVMWIVIGVVVVAFIGVIVAIVKRKNKSSTQSQFQPPQSYGDSFYSASRRAMQQPAYGARRPLGTSFDSTF